MKKIKVLNLYGGIGGNVAALDRSLYDITTVEICPGIAAVYANRFPMDKVIVGDAVEFLLSHYADFDFIWASPPCPSHSNVRKILVGYNRAPVLPDMVLYSIIIFLEHHFDGQYVVENVIPYYEPLIKPTITLDRHFFWSNFSISPISVSKDIRISHIDVASFSHISFDGFKGRKDTLIRNMVDETVALHIFNCAADTVPYSYDSVSLFDYMEKTS